FCTRTELYERLVSSALSLPYINRLTYDLRDCRWVRIVDPRPGVWRPPVAHDQTRISFPPDRSRCEDLGRLEILNYLASRKLPGHCQVSISPDGTRAWLQCESLSSSINVWRMPGAPSR